MSYIFNIVDFRLSPLLQDFPYFDICWTRIPVIPLIKQTYIGGLWLYNELFIQHS